MSYDERVELCRKMEDPKSVHIYDTMLTRARSERLDEPVVQQVRIELTEHCSRDRCTDDDLGSVERLGVPRVLISPQKWTREKGACFLHSRPLLR